MLMISLVVDMVFTGFQLKKRLLMILYKMASKNRIIAVALMACITRRLKLVGLLGSFFLKKYMLAKLQQGRGV